MLSDNQKGLYKKALCHTITTFKVDDFKDRTEEQAMSLYDSEI